MNSNHETKDPSLQTGLPPLPTDREHVADPATTDDAAMAAGSATGINPQNPASMPRHDDHPGGVENSQEFTDRDGPSDATGQLSRADEKSGQLGPDELPDPQEVVNSNKAKLKVPELPPQA